MPEGFTKPSQPVSGGHDHDAGQNSRTQNLTNDDFRKLMMTPRVGQPTTDHSSARQAQGTTFTHRATVDARKNKGDSKKRKPSNHHHKKGDEDDDDEDNLAAILRGYRDRAKERREGTDTVKDQLEEAQRDGGAGTQQSGYHAVAPNVSINRSMAERRRQTIEESKYLGGDMEHTHLVKGLDYALLQKVRSEIVYKTKGEDNELDDAYEKGEKKSAGSSSRRKKKGGTSPEPSSTEPEVTAASVAPSVQSGMAKNLFRVLFEETPTTVNDHFGPRRMAYVMDLGEEAETDIPMTLLRSKAECPTVESMSSIMPNNMIIQKLTQVLAYLHTDTKRKKKGKEKLEVADVRKIADQKIYDDIGDYAPPNPTSSGKIKTEKEVVVSGRERDRKEGQRRDDKAVRGHDYRSGDQRPRTSTGGGGSFNHSNERPVKPEEKVNSSGGNWDRSEFSRSGDKPRINEQPSSSSNITSKSKSGFSRMVVDEEEEETDEHPVKRDRDAMSSDLKAGISLMGSNDFDTYAECYPDAMEPFGGIDSDDETDFTKMDMGNKKGPIKRWDFDNDDEYNDYMSRREALPKAAFQYGVKMNDGRKTRKVPGGRSEKDEKAKLDREWNKISAMISKRQSAGGPSGGGGKRAKFM